jgi:hypothetical protein
MHIISGEEYYMQMMQEYYMQMQMMHLSSIPLTQKHPALFLTICVLEWFLCMGSTTSIRTTSSL